MLGDGSAFRGLYEDPAGTLERHLERLAAAASRKGLEGDIAPDARSNTAAPGDGGLGVGEGWGRGVEEDWLTVRGDGDLARSFEDDVEEATGEPAGAFDAHYIPVYTRLEGEDVVAVDGHPLVVQDRGPDLALVQREEEGARDGLLEVTAQATALVLEADVALVGDHRAELGLDLVVLQPHLEHRRVLQREPPRRRNLPKLLQVRLTHRITSLSDRSKRYYLGTKHPSISFLEHPAPRRDPVIWGEEHHVPIPVRYAEDEHFALEARDPLRRKIDYGNDLPTNQSLRLIVRRELGAGLLDPDLRSEGHHELDRRLACLREMLGLDDRADS